jgi:hypothetical protein
MSNPTSGSERRGYRGGRTRTYPKSVLTWHLQVRALSDEQYAKAIVLGSGNAAQGVRIALDRTELQGAQAAAPRTRAEAETWVALRKARISAGVSTDDEEDDFETDNAGTDEPYEDPESDND